MSQMLLKILHMVHASQYLLSFHVYFLLLDVFLSENKHDNVKRPPLEKKLGICRSKVVPTSTKIA